MNEDQLNTEERIALNVAYEKAYEGLNEMGALLPDSESLADGDLTKVKHDLFEVLSRYFPIPF